jgi:hypothetical protein
MDRVHTIMLMDDSVSTPNGVYLGAPLDALLAAYGNDYELAYDLYVFTRGNTTLRVLVGDGIVENISYELITS